MSRKHGVLAVVALLAIPLAIVATAFACGSLATLKLDRSAAKPGATVSARGANFNSSPNASAVTLRFNGRGGQVLWEGRPGSDGRFTAGFAAPDVKPGYYVIVATQTGPDGRPAAGTPGRAPLRIKGRKRARSSSEAVPTGAGPPGDRPAPPAVAPVVVLVLGLGMAMLLSGGTLLARTTRRRRRAFGPVRSTS